MISLYLWYSLYPLSRTILSQYGDDLSILSACVPSKTSGEVSEYYFRFIYSAVQIEKESLPVSASWGLPCPVLPCPRPWPWPLNRSCNYDSSALSSVLCLQCLKWNTHMCFSRSRHLFPPSSRIKRSKGSDEMSDAEECLPHATVTHLPLIISDIIFYFIATCWWRGCGWLSVLFCSILLH